MSMGMPFAPSEGPGVERFAFSPYYAGSGASPRTWNVQLPGYGAWMLYLFAWHTNANISIDAMVTASWFRSTASGVQTKNLGRTRAIGAAGPAKDGTSGTANNWTDLVASDPSDTGLITVTGSFSGGGTVNPRLVVKGFRIADPIDFTR